ncbi:MAG: PaaI family thioesterase [Deltaproteobacteria bacterium]|nr:PaaI family thioesterase [Deltaproteobacteria bacterium]
MKELNPEWTAAIRGHVNACPHFSLQSMVIEELSLGMARVEIDVRQKHLQPFGMVHGGVFSTLIDSAGFWAYYTEVISGAGMTTVEMKLNYLAPALNGRLIGTGRTIKVGRTLGLADARIEDQRGRLLAYGTVTLMVLPDIKLYDQEEFPVKFVSE